LRLRAAVQARRHRGLPMLPTLASSCCWRSATMRRAISCRSVAAASSRASRPARRPTAGQAPGRRRLRGRGAAGPPPGRGSSGGGRPARRGHARPHRFRAALLKVARCVEAELDARPLQGLAQQVLIELAGSLVIVQPAADRRDQALGLGQRLAVDRGRPAHRSNQPRVRPALLRQSCPKPRPIRPRSRHHACSSRTFNGSS
jgi:hypothetical protein